MTSGPIRPMARSVRCRAVWTVVRWPAPRFDAVQSSPRCPSASRGAQPLDSASDSAVAPADEVSEQLQQRAAEQLFRVLGELKGGAMKFGQALSLFESVLPEEVAAPYRAHLARLQDAAPPMPTSRVHAVLARELGSHWRDSLIDFDPLPAAAASIGQVHQATWSDGRTVAVKVQYPGADEALRSDLRQIGRLSKVFAPLAGGMDVSTARGRAHRPGHRRARLHPGGSLAAAGGDWLRRAARSSTCRWCWPARRRSW